MKNFFKVVPDTNIVIASEKSSSKSSPNIEFFNRWKNNEFEILYSDDTLLEYIEKMKELNISHETIKKLIRSMFELGIQVKIIFYHLPVYPSDLKDIAFFVCAANGNATYIISYDLHLKEIDYYYSFRICETLEFLFELKN